MKKLLLIPVLILIVTGSLFARIGDANGDNDVNIVDALIVAQYYVGFDPDFLYFNCDVNADDDLTIVDALMISQYYVGILPAFKATEPRLPKFQSPEDLIEAFENTQNNYSDYWMGVDMMFRAPMPVPGMGTPMPMPVPTQAPVDQPDVSSPDDFSTTNVQVEGVDEADIIKTDGDYVYMLSGNKLVIADSYPAAAAVVVSETILAGITPLEMFVHGDKLLVYGRVSYRFDGMYPTPPPPSSTGFYYYSYPSTSSFVSVRLYDITDRYNPELLRTVDVEGNYLTSRKIGSWTYFVVNSNPYYIMDTPAWEDIVPMYRDTDVDTAPVQEDMVPLCPVNQIGYVRPIQAQQFLTVASISMEDENAEVKKKVIVGSGNNAFSSLENFYVAQTNWARYAPTGLPVDSFAERTQVTKFAIADGDITFAAGGSAKGHILNQFSMDEYDNHFRIATTIGQVSRIGGESTNNVYILDSEMQPTGALEDLAPGEKIYSVRFTGNKGYLVTFKKVDPLFVIDLSDHANPAVLGELKIPGFSDYLHPYDENHIIGLGKDTEAADTGNFAWFQGVKLALFDVTDVTNPIQLHEEIIGHRGTTSEALREHKAFLFSLAKNMLVLPISLSEFPQGTEPSFPSQSAPRIFQGAYVYDLSAESGFNLRGRIAHNDESSSLIGPAIRRSLYIEETLYTFSNNRLQMNDLATLNIVNALDF